MFMGIFSLVLTMIGGLCMFLFGMKMMSDGLQKSAGERMRKTLNLMTSNRFAGLLTGFVATAIIQSSSAFSVIIVSFVNAGLITLTQSVGVIFGTNIGTTLTGWIISIIGFKVHIDSFAIPAIGIGFILSVIKWKYRSVGDFLLGFGFLFLGLHFLTAELGADTARDLLDFEAIGALSEKKHLSVLIGFGVGLVMTIIINSSTAAITVIMALAFQGIISYEMAAGMVLGANIGTTTDAPLASLAGNTDAKRTALAHVLFSVIGVMWALPLLFPLLKLLAVFLPGDPWAAGPSNGAIPLHIAGLHTIFNLFTAALLLPFVKQYVKLVSFILPDKITEKKSGPYKFSYLSSANANLPELNILRAEKEISDMAGIVSFMYSRFTEALRGMRETGGEGKGNTVVALCEELEQKEQYVDEMRETLSGFLVECSYMKLNPHSDIRVANLLRVIRNLEEMSDECYSISRLLEKSVRKKCVFKEKGMDDLIPYVGQVEEFLALLEQQLGRRPTAEQKARATELEESIDKNRKKLDKLSRKRIEAGEDVKTELIFIDLVSRIEKLGDYCFDIAEVV
ncbi:MAG: Na/Pi cotransporter family protein [Treponema sp.]|nr:Na/Pi cotransporter family protein [Treponema sp.]